MHDNLLTSSARRGAMRPAALMALTIVVVALLALVFWMQQPGPGPVMSSRILTPDLSAAQDTRPVAPRSPATAAPTRPAPSPTPAVQEPEVHLSGTVKAEADGTPIPGATIELLQIDSFSDYAIESSIVKTTTADAEGRFELTREERPSPDSLTVRVSAGGFAPAVYAFEDLGAQTMRRSFHPRLVRAITLAGTVVDDAGNPVPGATVGPWKLDQQLDRIDDITYRTYFGTAAEADEGGRFRFTDIPAGTQLSLVARADGFLPGQTSGIVAGADDIQIPLLKGSGTVTGSVLDHNGAPAQDVTLAISLVAQTEELDQRAKLLMPLRPDPSGRYTFSGVTPGLVDVYVRHSNPALGEYPIAEQRVDLAEGQTLELNLQLPEPARVIGRAYDFDSDKGVSDIEVFSTFNALSDPLAAPLALTGPDGLFQFEVAPSSDGTPVHVYYRVPAGWVPLSDKGSLLAITDPTGGRDHEVAIQLMPGVEVRGRVLLSDGETPAAGEIVNITGGGMTWRGRNTWPVTDSDGRFSATLRRNSYAAVSVAGETGSVLEQIRVPAVGDPPEVRLVLADYATVSGVVTVEGEPVAGLQVFANYVQQIEDPEGNPRTQTITANAARTDEKGAYALEKVRPGDVEIAVASDRFRSESGASLPYPEPEPLKLQLSPGDVRRDVNIELARGKTVRGTVKDLEGQPIENAIVALLPPQASAQIGVTKATPSEQPETRTAADGSFVLRGLPESTAFPVQMSVQHPGYRSGTFTVASESDRPSVAMEPLPDVTLRVLDGEQPVTRYEVRLTRPFVSEEIPFTAVESASGETILKAQPAGEFLLEIRVPGEAGARERSFPITIPAGPKAPPIVVDLKQAIDLTGQVRFADGAPAAKVRAAVWIPLGQGSTFIPSGAAALDEAITDQDGNFTLHVPGPGSYMIGAEASPFITASIPLTIDGSGTAPELKLELERTSTLQVDVLPPDGDTDAPPQGARYQLMPAGGGQTLEGPLPFQEQSRSFLKDIPRGEYDAVVTLASGEQVAHRIRIASAVASIAFDFRRNVAVSGKVTVNGKPWEGTPQLTFTRPDTARIYPGEGGQYRVNLAAGPAQLSLRDGQHVRDAAPPFIIPGESEFQKDFDLQLSDVTLLFNIPDGSSPPAGRVIVRGRDGSGQYSGRPAFHAPLSGGSMTVSFLPEGSWQVEFWPQGADQPAAQQEIRVTTGGENQFELPLPQSSLRP